MDQINDGAIRQYVVKTSGTDLHVTEEGPASATPIIFSHSIMTNALMWTGQVQALTNDFRIIRYDSRGHGQSAAGSSTYTTSMLASDVIAIADALNIQAFHFVGLSLGGIIGFDLASNHPSRLLSLMICDARADSPEEFARPWDERIRIAKENGMQALVEPTMTRWFGNEFLATTRADDIRAMITGTSIDGFIATAKALQSYDYRQAINHLGVKTTLVVGERDGILPAVMESQASGLENTSFKVIPSAGHLPNLENPKAFNDVPSEHLSLPAPAGFNAVPN